MANIMQKRVIKIAFVSRLISLAAQSAFDNLITDYDSSEEHCSSAGQIITGHNIQSNNSKNWNSFADQTVLSLVGGNSKWDAVYFLDIARNGYRYEQNMAFFPLLPLLVRFLGTIFNPMQEYFSLHHKALLILAATVINTSAFVLAALGLFCLTKRVFHDQKLAYMTALFFCFNPASVFFSAAYSESVFAMTQFWGMYYLENEPSSGYLSAAVFLALGSATRSNGMVSIGFIAYKILTDILRTNWWKFKVDRRWILLRTLFLKASQMLLLASVVALPFVVFQYYGFLLFCRSTVTPPWCEHSLVPLPYSYLQKKYWNVGFLKYYELKQLPNFFLAMPVILIAILGVFDWLKNQTWNDTWNEIVSPTRRFTGPYSSNVFVYVVHLSFLLLFGITSMHVQVVTRFVASSSPMIYWIAASWTMPHKCDKNDATMYSNLKSNLVYIYFLVYFWLGFVLHCNFYPWT